MENSEFENHAQRLWPAMVAMCRGFFRNGNMPDESEDIVQETFLRLWRMRLRLPAGERPDALVVRMVKNLCIDRFRKGTQRYEPVETMEVASGQTPETDLIHDEAVNGLRAAIDRLPASQQRMLNMKADGMSLDEIALVCGTTKNCVKTQISSARRKLLTQLNNIRNAESE